MLGILKITGGQKLELRVFLCREVIIYFLWILTTSVSEDFFEKYFLPSMIKGMFFCFSYEIKENKDTIFVLPPLICGTRGYLFGKNEFLEMNFIELFKTDMMYNVWSRIHNKSFILKTRYSVSLVNQ